jgi:pimeloyl-ACP methyl ester carboxylesterase
MRANDPHGIADAQLAMADRRDATPLLGQIRCPTLVIAGDEDAVIPLEEMTAMQRGILGASIAIIEKAGHIVNMERPEAFNALLKSFLLKHAEVSSP